MFICKRALSFHVAFLLRDLTFFFNWDSLDARLYSQVMELQEKEAQKD